MSTQREDFELKISMEFEQPPCIDCDGDGYADGYVDNAWWGYQKGWQAHAEQKWISVDDSLPPFLKHDGHPTEPMYETKRLLTCNVDGFIEIDKCYQIGNGKPFFGINKNVTHWMPLPQPPKEKL